ncbi:translocation protein TolB [Planctomycetes bacterium Poly30]|uniref:Translocation protein TolB n=1 Tax=Saltatorellus ferox TaxID=2528018 RepID=A0A518ES51_9BACT|nr:translocation protein TolB [Planctomycetes bacterium Poly30]
MISTVSSSSPARRTLVHPSLLTSVVVALLAPSTLSCAFTGDQAKQAKEAPAVSPVPGCTLVNELILPEEVHFKNLWQVTFGGQNAEAYWNFADDQLSLQIMNKSDGRNCDRIYVTGADGSMRQVSNGVGVTTCAFFMPDDEAVLYASTQSGHDGCPTKPPSEVYTWMLWPDYDIYVRELGTGMEKPLVEAYGYDAEATVSPQGDRIVFTSTRSGDVELWTCDLDGQNLQQVTDTLGYDGGAFFNHAGDRLVFRTTAWTPGDEDREQAAYREDLQRWQVRPNNMEIYTIRPDGSEREQVTALGGANFAPYFLPDDQRIIFSSNHHSREINGVKFNFDLFICDLDGRNLERITYFDDVPGKQFDSFPMFSHDGKYLAFSSNRGDGKVGDTNVFIAEWIEDPAAVEAPPK